MKTGYEVCIQIAPSQGGEKVKVAISDATDPADAITKAALKLDDKGKTYWSLLYVVPTTS